MTLRTWNDGLLGHFTEAEAQLRAEQRRTVAQLDIHEARYRLELHQNHLDDLRRQSQK